MKRENENRKQVAGGAGAAFKKACVGSCQKIIAQVNRAKAAIFAESRKALQAHERLLQLALNEAEAIAWQTNYPHLFFPTLAVEKVQALRDWNVHQKSVRRASAVSRSLFERRGVSSV